MKKIVALCMSIVSILVMTACAGNLTAYEMYVKASEALNNADSLRMNMVMDMQMEISGETMEIRMEGVADQVINSETDIDMLMDMSTMVMGTSVDYNAYYTDGVMYTDMAGMKSQSALTIDEAMQSTVTPLDFPEDAIKLQSMNDVEGGKEIAITLDSSLVEDMISGQMESMTAILGEDAEMSIGDIELTTVISNDNQFQTLDISFPMEMGVEGQQVTVTVDMFMEIEQVGGITIEFPDDLASYPEGEAAF